MKIREYQLSVGELPYFDHTNSERVFTTDRNGDLYEVLGSPGNCTRFAVGLVSEDQIHLNLSVFFESREVIIVRSAYPNTMGFICMGYSG